MPVLGTRLPEQMTYRMAQLASHKVTGDRQVYVWAADRTGLDEFKADFPTAEIRQNAKFKTNRAEWFIEMFPAEDDGVRDPYEVFLAGMNMVVRSDGERKERRKRERDAEDARKKIRNEPPSTAVPTTDSPAVATVTGGGKKNT
jgi:hypothetical protein